MSETTETALQRVLVKAVVQLGHDVSALAVQIQLLREELQKARGRGSLRN